MECLSNISLLWGSQYLLYSNPLSLQPLPLQTLPFQLLSLHLKSLSLPEEVLPFFTLPVFTFSYFPSPWGEGGVSKIKHPEQTFVFHTSTHTNNLTYLRISAARRKRSIRSCILCSFIFSNGKMSSPLLTKGRCLLFIISNWDRQETQMWTTVNW